MSDTARLQQQVRLLQEEVAALEQQRQQLQDDRKSAQADLGKLAHKNETLEQSNYSLSLKLKSTEQTLESCSSELESLQEQTDRHSRSTTDRLTQQHETEITGLRERLSEAEELCETSEQERTSLLRRAQDAEVSAEEYRRAAEEAVTAALQRNDTEDAEKTIDRLRRDNKALKESLERTEAERASTATQMTRCEATIQQLSHELQCKECALNSQDNEVQRLKDDILERDQELDLCRMQEKDPKTKGNSLFAELEDNRVLLERELLKLRASSTTIVKQLQCKQQQTSRLKMQVAALMAQSGSVGDSTYIQHLNSSLGLARSQLCDLKDQCSDMANTISKQALTPIVIQCPPRGCTTRSSYYQNTFDANRAELTKLKGELQDTRFQSTLLSDQILTIQRQLHSADCKAKHAQAEALKFKIQLEDIKTQRGMYAEHQEQEVVEPRIEYLPGYEEKMEKEKREREEQEKKDKETQQKIEEAEEQKKREDLLSINKCSSRTESVIEDIVSSDTPDKTAGVEETNVQQPTATLQSLDDQRTETSHGPSLLSNSLKRRFLDDDENMAEEMKENLSGDHTSSACLSRIARVKKSVRMQDVVQVQDTDGQRTAASLKTADGSGEKLRKPLRKMELVKPQPLAPAISECNQQ